MLIFRGHRSLLLMLACCAAWLSLRCQATHEDERYPPPEYEEPEQSGLLAYFSFQGEIRDMAPFSREILIGGEPRLVEDRFGIPEAACFFDGDDDFLMFSVDYRRVLAVSLWYQPEVSLSNTTLVDYGLGEFQTRVDAASGATIPYYTLAHQVGEEPALYTRTQFIFSGWHHLYVDSGDRDQPPRIYVDGVLENQAALPVSFQIQSDLLSLARKPEGTTTRFGYFRGAIDEVRIYDTLLEESEILFLASETE